MTDFGDFCDKIEVALERYFKAKTLQNPTFFISEKRFEGNSDIKRSKRDILRKQYECFRYLKNESTDELISRFNHLQTELKAFELKYPDEELDENFLDALPQKFEMRPQIQDLSMYYGTSSIAKSSGSGIALLSRNSLEEDNSNGCRGHTCFTASRSGSHHQHSSRNPTSTSSANQTAIAKIAEDHVALFSSCMLAYENFIGGKLTDPETIEEDFNQVDPDDMEDMDIQWNMAMILRRAKRFLNRTGRKFIGWHSNAKVSSDKSKAKCYKCQNFGHFAGECQVGTSNALVAQQDEIFDWAVHLEDALIAQTQVGLMVEIVGMIEAEEREASVADQEESTTAFSLMAIGEASSSSTEVDSNSFAVISCSKCLGLKEENSKLQDKVEPLRIAALSYKENEKRYKDSIETLKKEKLLQLNGKIEKLKNSRFVVEHYESVVRQVNGLGLGTNPIPPLVSGKFANGLNDTDLSCLDESSSHDDSSNKDDSSSKADSASNQELFTDEGTENTIPDGAVLEELIGEHKVKKN
ncbi:hypothetical protein L1987_09147 [Smallanthus sonchifolius]|uniref:Uncharacterized protein n=1 Tax=Smallanthus sonchifolius TaxID=185202 RepID=A0ACB9JMM5_9ASTR|nr:hypothetical protein L1987_09147 [Smallanthus sonchifolius]